jgi:adenylate kinase family enzyme
MAAQKACITSRLDMTHATYLRPSGGPHGQPGVRVHVGDLRLGPGILRRVSEVADPQRVLVYGVTGSGKSTLAARMAAATGIPWHAVDDMTWEPGWVPVPVDEQRRRIEAICEGDRWILDSAYEQWLDVPLDRAQLVVGLDYPRIVSFARLARRTVARTIDRQLVCNGNVETWRGALSDDSILRWHFRSFARKRARLRAWAADPSMPPTILLRSPAATERWMRALVAGSK